MEQPRRSRGTRPLVLLLVAVLAGLGLGRFLTAGDDAPEATTTRVAGAVDLDARIAQLRAAVASDPQDVGSLQQLGTAYVQRAVQTGDAASYAQARDALDRAERLAPGAVETTVARGVLALSLHAFPEALDLGEQALQQRPGNATVLGLVVDAQIELGRYDDAAATLQTMLDRDPGLPALARTSYQRELTGDLDGAVEAMRAAVGSAADGADAAAVSVLLGDLLLQQSQPDDADAAYAAALREAPTLAAARVGAARVQALRGDLDGAVAALDQLSQEQPTIGGLVLLAELQRELGDADAVGDTAEVVRAVARLQEQAGQVVDLEMALFEADFGEPARALELARAAHEARPDNVFTTDALAWATFRSGDVAEAAALSTRALRLGSVSPVLRSHAAQIAAAAGSPDEARSHLGVVLRGAPYAAGVDAPAVRALALQLAAPLPRLWQVEGSPT